MGLSLVKGRWSCFPCVGWHEITWMFWFKKWTARFFTGTTDMYDCACNYKPLTSWWGWSICFKIRDFKGPLIWEIMGGGWEGQGREGIGHSFWHQGLNRVGSKSGPDNLKLLLHSWAISGTRPQLTCKVMACPRWWQWTKCIGRAQW